MTAAETAAEGDALRIIGGVGGAAVNLAELDDLSGALRRAGDVLESASAVLLAADASLGPAHDLAPVAAAEAGLAVRLARESAAALGADVAELAGAACLARRAYEEAEVGVLRRVAAAVSPRGVSGLLPGFGPAVALPEGLLPAPLDIGRPHQLLLGLGWALAGGAAGGAHVDVTATDVRDAPTGAPRGVADLVAGIDALYPASGGQPGSVEVRRLEHRDGAVSWVVLVPGTQTFAVGGENPMDTATNVQALVGAPSAVAAGVVAALRAAGAGRDQPVLLAGHSQGGMVATRLAADAAFRREFRVRGVLTAGSPVGHVPTPPGTAVLHLEHPRDAVPVLDDARNPDTADRVTVVRAAAGSPGQVHEASGYARTGAVVDASTHPSVAGWRRGVRDVLGDGEATATRTVYRLRRVPPAPTGPAPVVVAPLPGVAAPLPVVVGSPAAAGDSDPVVVGSPSAAGDSDPVVVGSPSGLTARQRGLAAPPPDASGAPAGP